ncbi:hypothetical protein TELCIR_18477 [Teladorsagia circumcincta]|uniref:Phosphofructokinase domain-containing protein n=1 Tax=Teladorsagia circumcincta TaxID=45464 RepID=A0A2G9TPX2_TELCI|nr:hypothetical protein TELCIR_18477 [Teladorsagia circumcincta]
MSHECGTLALTAGIALEADFVFIPEIPPPDDWPEVLCGHLHRKRKRRPTRSNPIQQTGSDASRTHYDKMQWNSKGQYDVRVASLGYLQRGGSPSFLDRLLGCRMGHEAVNTVLNSDPASPRMLCLKGIFKSNNHVFNNA